MIDAFIKLKNKLFTLVSHGLIQRVNATGKVLQLQVELVDNPNPPEITYGQHYGFFSVPFKDVESLVLSINGDRTNAFCVSTIDTESDLISKSQGDVGLRTRSGHIIHLKNDGNFYLKSKINQIFDMKENGDIEASNGNASFVLKANGDVEFNGGGPAVARVGDQVQVTVIGGSSAGTHTGTIISGSNTVKSG